MDYTDRVFKLAPCFTVAVILACGPENAGTDGTGTATTGAATSTGEPGTTSDASTGSSTAAPTTGAPTTGEPTTGEPVCIDFFMMDYDQNVEIPPPLFTCGLPELCPGPDGEPLVFTDETQFITTKDLERAHCMGAAMRDRTPGLFRFTVWPILGFDTTTIEILGETILVRRHVLSDFNEDYSEKGHRLFAPEEYAKCTTGSAAIVLKCLTEGYEETCVSEPLMCPA